MGSPCLVKMSGVQALLSRVENALGASAVTRNLMSVFMCLLILLLSIAVPTDERRSL
jgi:hypothetical protein